MRWLDLLKKQNAYAKTATDQALQKHQDPKVLVAQQLQDASERHKALEASCAQVIANNKLTEMRLNKALRTQTDLERSINTALEHGHEGDAKIFVVQLAQVRDEVESLKLTHEATVANATKAQSALKDNAEMVRAKMAEARDLKMKIDQTAMAKQMTENMAAVNDITGTEIPTFEQISERIDEEYALASAQADSQQDNPQVAIMHAHRTAISDRADSLLEEFKAKRALPASDAVPALSEANG